MKLAFVVGEAPSVACEPRLFCTGKFGQRIADLAEIHMLEYCRHFARLNLYPQPEKPKHTFNEDVSAARRVITEILHDCVRLGCYQAVICCMGSRVSTSMCGWVFGTTEPVVNYQASLARGRVRTSTTTMGIVGWEHGVSLRLLYMPHPSGLCRAWNDPAVCRTVADSFKQLYVNCEHYTDAAYRAAYGKRRDANKEPSQ